MTSHNEGLYAGAGFDKLCKSNTEFYLKYDIFKYGVRGHAARSSRPLGRRMPIGGFPFKRSQKRYNDSAPRGQYKCAVARMFEAVQVMHAAGRQEVLPTETVKAEGSDWVNLPGLGNDFTNPNWNWVNSQNPMTIMDVINQDRSDADRAQEDAMQE